MTNRLVIERWNVQRIDGHFPAFTALLQACVMAGASIGFILPLTAEAAAHFWRDTVAAEVAAGRRLLLAAQLDGQLVGSVQLVHDMPANQPHRAEVAKLLVDPRFRRQGIARRLMQAVEKEARALDRELLTLDTRTGDLAEPLYLSLGYQVAGRIPGYALDALDVTKRDATTLMYKTLTPSAVKLGAPC